MRFSTTTSILSGLTLLSTASARIIGLEAPRTIAAGEPFTVSLLTENYIVVYDVAAAFGISPGAGYPETLGTVIGSSYIGPDGSDTLDKLNFTVSTSKSQVAGPSTLSASVLSLYGVSSGPVLYPFNVSVTVGDTTSLGQLHSYHGPVSPPRLTNLTLDSGTGRNPRMGGQNFTHCCLLAVNASVDIKYGYISEGTSSFMKASVEDLPAATEANQFPCTATWDGSSAGAPLVEVL
ncbi:hypothetical protein IFR04_011296 [Cadophora malorum]|uniref:Uncharacterized protein n=1 Tax=Cadophora malorum TaxID=108018 RepID=A0A8H7T9S5_9HELO|nr:hypothetical protein IFR04_011296 [Cadophora malorum]